MRALAAVLATMVALVTILACDGGGVAVACEIDAECPTAFVCRANECIPVAPDGGTVPLDDGGLGQACARETASCFASNDCCTGTCTNGACSSSVVSTQPACIGVTGLCQNDCCDGLTCVKGVCQ